MSLRRTLVAAVALALPLVVAACSDDSDNSPNTSVTTTGSNTTVGGSNTTTGGTQTTVVGTTTTT